MYLALVFLFLLANNVTIIVAMDEEVTSFHDIINKVARGNFSEKEAKKMVENLVNNRENLSEEENYETAAETCVWYCMQSSRCFEIQLDLLAHLFNKEANRANLKKKILDDLTEQQEKLLLSQDGLKRAPFKSKRVYGGGSFIDDEREEEDYELLKNKENRIRCVRELVEKISD